MKLPLLNESLRRHLPYFAVLAALTIVFLSSWWLSPNSHTLGDVITYYYPRAVMLKQSIFEYNDFLPLWNPYIFSGDTLIGKPAFLNAFQPFGLFILFLQPLDALKWAVIADIFLAGLFMYLFVHYLTSNRQAAFISAIAYMFSGFVLTTVIFYGWVVFANAYMLFPLLFLFLFRAVNDGNEKVIVNSVFLGVVLGLLIIMGSGIEFLYASVIVGIFLLMYLAGSDLRARIVKSFVIGGIAVVVCFGLSAFKLLPVLEYQKSSVRMAYDWNDASGRVLHASKFFSDLVEPGFPKFFQSPSNKVGIFAFMLALFAVFRKPKSRAVLFFSGVIAVSLLLASGSFLLYLFWKFYPGWHGMRYANRAIIMLAPAAAVLAGIGANSLFVVLREKLRLSSRHVNAVFLAVAALVLLNLTVFGSGGQSNAGDDRYKYWNINEVVASNQILQNLSAQRKESIFRINAAETFGIDWGTEFYTVPLGLENIFGYDTDWQQEYVNFYLYALSVTDVPKLWGILNVRYITSKNLIDTSSERFSDLALAGKFDNCSICFPEEPVIQKAWGPYLYENKRSLPRAFLINYSILVIAHPDIRLSVIQTLLTRKDFDPRQAVIVFGHKDKNAISDYGLEDLKKYEKVVLAGGGGDGSGMHVLKSYVDGGGILMPNILGGETTFTTGHLERVFAGIGGSHEPVSDSAIVEVNFDKKEVRLPQNANGRFLVMSERYSSFSGWTAKAAGKNGEKELELLHANGAVTAVYIDDDYDKVVFEYRPKSFVVGSVITVASLFALLGYFAYLFFSARAKSKSAPA